MARSNITSITCAAALLVTANGAFARSGGIGGAHAMPFGHGLHCCAPNHGAWSRRPAHQFWYSPLLVGDDLSYGNYDGGVATYDVNDAGVNFLGAPIPSARISRPSCRLETQTYVVPSELGGERQIAVTRCVNSGALRSGVPDR